MTHGPPSTNSAYATLFLLLPPHGPSPFPQHRGHSFYPRVSGRPIFLLIPINTVSLTRTNLTLLAPFGLAPLADGPSKRATRAYHTTGVSRTAPGREPGVQAGGACERWPDLCSKAERPNSLSSFSIPSSLLVLLVVRFPFLLRTRCTSSMLSFIMVSSFAPPCLDLF